MRLPRLTVLQALLLVAVIAVGLTRSCIPDTI